MKVFKKTKDNDFTWSYGHVHPCCCLRFSEQATAPPRFVDTSTRVVASTFKNYKNHDSSNKNQQRRSSAPSTPAWHSICTVSSKLITQSAPSPLSSSDRNEASPSQKFKKRHLEKKKKGCLARCVLRDDHKAHFACGFHRRRFATRWCRPSCRPPHRQGHPGGLVMVCGTVLHFPPTDSAHR